MSKDMISAHVCLIPLDISLVSSVSGTTEYQIFRRICKNEVTKSSLETKPIDLVGGIIFEGSSMIELSTRLRE